MPSQCNIEVISFTLIHCHEILDTSMLGNLSWFDVCRFFHSFEATSSEADSWLLF